MRVQKQIDRLLAQQAAEWMEALKSGDRRCHEAFIDWLCQSKLHVEHYLEQECMDAQIRSLDKTRGPDIEALLKEVSQDVRPIDSTLLASGKEPRPRQRAWRIAAMAAGVAVLGTLTVLWQQGLLSPMDRVSTAAGEQRTLTLPDGSLIRMNVDTTVRFDYGPKKRSIELISGEALFKVAKDASRPFIVHTSTADVRAVGTEFNVYLRESQALTVSVIEGRVQVTTQPAHSVLLAGGEEARVTQNRIERRSHPDVFKTISWRERRLFFDDTPLEEMVREFNRYGGPVTLRTEGIEPDSFRFGGTFNADDPGSFADILEQQKDLSVERRPGEILIRKSARVSPPITDTVP